MIDFTSVSTEDVVIESPSACLVCVARGLWAKCPRCKGTGQAPVFVRPIATAQDVVTAVRRYTEQHNAFAPRLILVRNLAWDVLKISPRFSNALKAEGVHKVMHTLDYYDEHEAAVCSALAHINDRYRARIGEHLLDPHEAGWTDDDVVIEALRVGWFT